MHWVDRGSEPLGLVPIRASNTLRWVRYYHCGVGRRPTDSRWRAFHCDLSRAFQGICAYCEEFCRGEVDHFRPKSRFPKLVYDWSNWVLACHDCNRTKNDNWPSSGYVDPCADIELEFPERYFDFDTQTGEMLPMQGLNRHFHTKAHQMIGDLQLNGRHHLKKRKVMLWYLGRFEQSVEDAKLLQELFPLASRNKPFSSLTRAWLLERGYAIDADHS